MKNGIITIMKKEFARFFGDRRILLTTLLLPGLMIYCVYTFMGDAITDAFSPNEDYIPSVYAENLPESVSLLAEAMDLTVKPADDPDAVKEQIRDQKTDVLMVFPSGFDEDVYEYLPESSNPAPNISIYYNSASVESSNVFNMIYGLLDEYEASLANKFDINADVSALYDMATEEDSSAMFISSLLPMLLMLFLFSGCMSLAPESIAGEKERGTIATLLVTPLKRREFAIGKLLSLSVLSLLCGISSMIGTMLSLPKLAGHAGDQVNLGIYNLTDYLLLGAILLSSVLLIVSLISIISAFAKTIKEATTAVTPFMIVVMLIGVTGMFSQGAPKEFSLYLIPLYNSVQSLVGIFSREYDTTLLLITVASNIVYSGVLGFILTKMFDNEKIVFSR